jgi:hypothetical protein
MIKRAQNKTFSFCQLLSPLQIKQNLQRPTPDLLICLQFLDESSVKIE